VDVRKSILLAVGLLTGLLAAAAAALGSSGGAHGAAVTAGCQASNNIEAIIDDSGSMAGTDPNKLRVNAMELFIDTPGNEQKTLGAVEFGTNADTLFKPRPIGPNRAADKSVLETKIDADNTLTNYNAAFALANSDNPTARARIFMTDGGHDEGDYDNSHLGGGKPPTYVIGFGSSSSGENGARLQKIATDTGGRYFPETDSSKLQPVMNEINARLNCLTPPKTFTNNFTKVGQTASRSASIPASTKTINITQTWSNTSSKFTVLGVNIVRAGKIVAASRVRKLKITRRAGKTFLVLQIRKVVRGRLRFRIRANKIGATSGFFDTTKPGRVTTQITQSRH
jgi:hypothetical protein